MDHRDAYRTDPVIVEVLHVGKIKNNVALELAHAHNQITRERGYI